MLTVNSQLPTNHPGAADKGLDERDLEHHMSTATPDPHLREVAQWHPVEGTPMKKRVAIGTSVGATIETYDFIGFGTAAALYFNTVFFPENDPLSGTLLSFATLGVGFAVRPLGGIIGGYLGDKIGRKPVLVGSLLLMGIATVLIGLLPTYQQVGVWAGILLVAVRVVQGLAFGAEWGGAILMCFEHAPWRKRGLYTGITQAGFPVGLLLANFAFLISAPLGEQWAWRVPFLLSAVLIVIGIVIRLKVEESPEFEELKEEGEIADNPLLEVIRNDWRNVLRAFCLRIAETAGYAVSVTFMLSYLATEELADSPVILTGLMLAAGIGIVATTCWGALTDRIGRRPVYLFGTAAIVAWGVPLFLLVNTGTALWIVLAFVVSYTICQNSLAGVQGAWFSELFTAKTRTTGASLAYQLSAVVSGFTPLVATALYASLGWTGPAVLFIGYGLLGLVAAVVTQETWGREERAAVAAIEQEASGNPAAGPNRPSVPSVSQS
jgi:MFS family permease